MIESGWLMKLDFRRLLSWPSAFAVLFFLIPPALFCWYPSSFWVNNDYAPLGLANALNMAYRIGDGQMYPARGMMDHPGVPFYFMSWLSLALAGYPVAPRGPGFLNTVIEHVEDYHRITVWLGALAGASGVYIFARAARYLVPVGVVAAGLLVWLTSTPATLLMFLSPSIDSFAILINALFFAVLVRLAYDRDIAPGMVILSGCVGAFAYLNKLSYIYVPLAFAVSGISNLAFRRAGWVRGSLHSMLFVLALLLVVVAVGYFVIGWDGFQILREFHKSVIRGSGLYGTGDRAVVSKHEIWRALAAIPADRAYAMVVALVCGAGLVVGGFFTAWKGPQDARVAVISIGTGVASCLSAVFVMKHYGLHYTAGVSATLPASMVAGYLLARSWGYTFRTTEIAVAAILTLFMSYQMVGQLIPMLAVQADNSRLAKADLEEIHSHLAGSKRTIEFAYKTPFAAYGRGFVVVYGSVPRLTEDYLQNESAVISSMMQGAANRDVGAYVIDKGYFPTAESVKTAPNVAPLGPKPVTFKHGDKLIELRTVFLLIPG